MKIVGSFICIAIVSGFMAACSAASIKRVFVLSGQSNMVRNFANMEDALKRNYGPDTLVIKSAVSGSSISQWQPGQPYYETSVAKTTRAIDDGYVLSGVLFFQGEADAKTETSRAWEKLFIKYINGFSADTGVTNIPIVFAHLGKVPTPADKYPFWREVVSQQSFAATMRPQYKMIETYDLGPYESGPYYHDNFADPAWVGTGYKEITKRFIAAIKTMVP